MKPEIIVETLGFSSPFSFWKSFKNCQERGFGWGETPETLPDPGKTISNLVLKSSIY